MFVCDECGALENSALAGVGGYIGARDGKRRCSECNPARGRWHGQWEKEPWDGVRPVVNRVTGTAEISADGHYRYRLTRRWGYGNKPCLFVMLNPSTADATTPDPTITRCIGFAKREGHEQLVVVNLYALRSRKPEILSEDIEPIGPENDRWILDEAAEADRIIVAWGTRSPRRERARLVTQMLSIAHPDLEPHGLGQPKPLECLGTTKHGHPRHPLYLAADTPLEPWATTPT